MKPKLVVGSITFSAAIIATGIGVGVYYGSKNKPSNDFKIIIPPKDELSIGICQSLDDDSGQVNSEIRNFRLSGNVIPSEYDLILYPNMDSVNADFFAGYVQITAEAKKDTDQIILHSSEQTIRNIELEINGESNKFGDCVTYKENEFLIIRDVKLLKNDRIVIKIEYEGPLLGRGVGFFKTSYDNGQKQQLIGSKHEPTYRSLLIS